MVWYVIDGMDGSGKTTVSDLIREQLESESRRVLQITHPNRNSIFGRISSRFLHIDSGVSVLIAPAFYILDVFRSLRILRNSKREYDDIIFVRYLMAVGYLPEKICDIAYRVLERVLPMPDIRIFVDLDAETSMKRITERGEDLEIFESAEKLDRTRNRMLRLTDGWIIIDNSKTESFTELQIRDIVDSSLALNKSSTSRE
ncbi:MAG: thymidylate kinase [Candidatus Methanomethylophilaceae archaeon]